MIVHVKEKEFAAAKTSEQIAASGIGALMKHRGSPESASSVPGVSWMEAVQHAGGRKLQVRENT
jgi:hypothetical protein